MWTVRFVNVVRIVAGTSVGTRANFARRKFSHAIIGYRCLGAATQNTVFNQQHVAGKSTSAGNQKSAAGRRERDELCLSDEHSIDDDSVVQVEPVKQNQKVNKSNVKRKDGRRPKRVEVENGDEKEAGKKVLRPQRSPKNDASPDGDDTKEPKSFRKIFNDQSLRVFDDDLKLSYIKLRYNNPELQAFMLMAKSKRYRAEKHLLMIEGRRLLLDALDAGLPLQYVLFSRHDQLKLITDKLVAKNATPQILRVPHHDLTFWSVMTTCPGLIGIFQKPVDMTEIHARTAAAGAARQCETLTGDIDETMQLQPIQKPQITVIIDQIRDPSNLGSLIRTCAALPCHQVLLTKGCADPWEAKALRGGAGGHFRVPIRGPMDWASLESMLPEPGAYSFFIADNNWRPRKLATLEEQLEVEEKRDEPDLSAERCLPYTSVSFKHCQHAVLVVGGETEGISREAYEMLVHNQRQWLSVRNELGPAAGEVSDEGDLSHGHHALQIPLANGVESLNTNAAASILLFEMRRQMQLK